jgi:hypothetical protein
VTTALRTLSALLLFAYVALPWSAFAHGVDSNTERFLLENAGRAIVPFLYIGAKHMITGYDHLLFLVGVIFFLYRSRDVLIYVSFFTLGHSLTLMAGVWYGTNVDPYLIDAIIGLSIVYKGFDNLGGFRRLLGVQPNTKAAVLIFGLFHGLGLAAKLQQFMPSTEGLLANLLAFNVGVELGQFSALALILIALSFWRRHPSFLRFSTATNTLLMSGGFVFVGYQMVGFLI